MNKRFYQLFYIVMFVMLLLNKGRYFSAIQNIKEYIWIAKPLNYFQLTENTYSLIYIFTLFLFLLSSFWAKKKLQIVSYFFFLLVFSISFSTGKIGHSYHAWLYAGMLMLLFKYNENKLRSNLLVIRLIQATLLMTYFLAGFWKIQKFFFSDFDFTTQFHRIMLRNISFAYAQGTVAHDFKNIMSPLFTNILSFSLILVIGLQITSIFAIFSKRLYRIIPILLILFHISSGLLLGIWFNRTIIALVLFFPIFDLFLAQEDRKISPNK